MPQFGRYRIERVIARGGMAEVFEAVAEGDDGFSRRVALKRILPGDGDADAALERMFLDEARIASRLHHANIVSVLDYGTVDGQPFQVLELVDGMHAGSLRRRGETAGTPMPEAVALHICAEVGHALGHAHRRTDENGAPLGIVHRDVSPSNILVSWDGDVKLSDFGIAFAHDRRERTEAGVTKGKISYMSPEQASGGRVDARSDVFSLGCVLHELFVGESPLATPNALATLFGEGELALDPGLPADVREICRRALARSPSERFASAMELAAALERAAATRLERGARTLLREWMEGLRSDPSPPKAKLDALLDLALVLQADEPGSRSFRSISMRPAGEADRASQLPTRAGKPEVHRDQQRVSEAAPMPEEGRVETQPASARSTRTPRRIFVGMVLALASLLGLSALATVGERTETAESTAGGNELPLERLPEPSISAPRPPPTEDSPASVEEPVTDFDAEAEAVVVLPRVRPRRRARGTSSSPEMPRVATSSSDTPRGIEESPAEPQATAPTPEPPSEPPSPRAAARGVLLVGGAGALRAQILVNGRSAGYAPRRLELSLGTHRVELVAVDGQRIDARTVELTERHTRLSPARWIVD